MSKEILVTALYLANWPLKHNGESVKAHAGIELSKDEAKPLLACGAIDGPIEDVVEATDELIEASKDVQLALVVDAIGALDLTNADNVTNAGLPDATVLTKAVGFNVSAALRNEAWQAFEAEKALADAIKEDGEQA